MQDLRRRADRLQVAVDAIAAPRRSIDLQALQGQLRAATLSSGTRLSASQARQLACRAGVAPAVLRRAQRLFNPAQGAALALRDGGCVFPGWQLRLSPDDGMVELRLPGHRYWQRNHRYRPGRSESVRQ